MEESNKSAKKNEDTTTAKGKSTEHQEDEDEDTTIITAKGTTTIILKESSNKSTKKKGDEDEDTITAKGKAIPEESSSNKSRAKQKETRTRIDTTLAASSERGRYRARLVRGECRWSDLPERLQTDTALLTSLMDLRDAGIVRDMLEQIPDLRSDVVFLRRAMMMADDDCCGLFRLAAPDAQGDFELQLRAFAGDLFRVRDLLNDLRACGRGAVLVSDFETKAQEMLKDPEMDGAKLRLVREAYENVVATRIVSDLGGSRAVAGMLGLLG